jgi:hypothetical protein
MGVRYRLKGGKSSLAALSFRGDALEPVFS